MCRNEDDGELNPNEDDLELNQLAREAQQHPDRSLERRRVLNRLANKIFQSRRLKRPRNDRLPPAVADDLYHEALNITLMEICQNIDKYDSTRGDVLGWVNFVLGKRYTDLIRKWRPHDCLSFNLEDIDRYVGQWSSSKSVSEELKQLIEEDPDNIFTRRHITGNPQATFQFLVLARFWEDRKWKDISAELNVPNSTLCEFFKNQLKELKPYLKVIFKDYSLI